MIAIVSSSIRERNALGCLCSARRWPVIECDSVRALRRYLRRDVPRVVLTRDRLDDGYSDDVIELFRQPGTTFQTRLIVLIGAGATSSHEARQVALGADCVQRDPVKINVLAEYLARYRCVESPPASRPRPESFTFATATVFPLELRIEHCGRSTAIRPRELELIELLHDSRGQVITYETLYRQILGRRFAGETSNLRVLLNKSANAFAEIGIPLRTMIRVFPKTGYRYDEPAAADRGYAPSPG